MGRGQLSENDARKLSKYQQTELRRRAVTAVKAGKKKIEVAECLSVSRRVVTKWCKIDKEYGYQALDGDNRGVPVGTKGKVKVDAKRDIIKMIIEKTPNNFGLPSQLWTRKAVLALIKKQYKVSYSLPTISRLLNSNGLTPQKPIYRASQRNPLKIQKWLQEEYPKIQEQAKKKRASIHWGDEMGIRSTHTNGRSFGLKNRTPVVKKTTKRFGCNIISTITNNGSFRFMVFTSSFNIAVFLNFLRKLIYRRKKKIFLILDNHKVHHSKKVHTWFEKHKKKIEVFFLPPYAPELNPDEMLNRNVKSNVSHSRLYTSQDDMTSSLRSYLFSLQRTPLKIQSFFVSKLLSYAAL